MHWLWRLRIGVPSESGNDERRVALAPYAAALLVAQIAEQLTFDLAWQQGDVALVDNFLVMHGRRSFRGRRKVLVSLVAAQQHVR